LIFIPFLIIISIITIINYKLIRNIEYCNDDIKEVLYKLNFLEKEIKEKALADKMQEMYPEGFIFTYALYGLAWCELASVHPNLKSKAIHEALYAYEKINSEAGKLNFFPTANLKFGIFYNGWSNYLLSKILLLDKTNRKLTLEFEKNCNEIITALNNCESPYLESYTGASWPADMIVGMASVSHFNGIIDNRYQKDIKSWLSRIDTLLDSYTGLIPHSVYPNNGKMLEGARGSSMSLIIKFFSEIDKNYSKKLYERYQKYFMETILGLPYIREYPKGKNGTGDIDSGPVIFDIGSAGTIVSIGTHASMQELNLSHQQYAVIDAFGLSYTIKERKKYLFGLLPIVDAFIVWSKASSLKYNKNTKESPYKMSMNFPIFSFILIIIFIYLSIKYLK
jgi:hypothetical protein